MPWPKSGASRLSASRSLDTLVAVVDACMTSFDAGGIWFLRIDATVFTVRAGEHSCFFSIAFGEVVLRQFREDTI